jgi:hypothetical protein
LWTCHCRSNGAFADIGIILRGIESKIPKHFAGERWREPHTHRNHLPEARIERQQLCMQRGQGRGAGAASVLLGEGGAVIPPQPALLCIVEN